MSEKAAPSPDVSPSDAGAPRGKRRRIAIALGGAFVIYLIAATFILPSIVESQLVEVVEGQTGVRPTVGEVSFNPFGWRLSLERFSLPDPAGENPLVAFESLVIDVAVLRLLSATVALEEVALVDPQISVVINEAGELNFLALVNEAPTETEDVADEDSGTDSELFKIDVDSIVIAGGEVHFVDESQQPTFEMQVRPLDLEIQGFSTRLGEDSPYSLVVHLGSDTELRWSGTIGLDPIRSQGEVSLSRLDLRVPWDFLSDQLRFEVVDGDFGFSTRYALTIDSSPASSGAVSLELNGAEVALRDLILQDRADDVAVISMPALAVRGVRASLSDAGLGTLSIDAVETEGGFLRSHIDAEGAFYVASLLTPIKQDSAGAADASQGEAGGAAVEGTTISSAAPKIEVARVAIQNLEIDLEDRSAARPVPLRFAPLTVVVEGYSSVGAEPLSLGVDSGIGEGGQLKLNGPLTLEPLSTKLEIVATKIGLGEYQPYLENFARIDVPKGTLSAALTVDFAAAENASTKPKVGVVGRLEIDDLMTIDRGHSRKVLEWESLRVEGLEFESERVRIEEIALSGALAHVVIGADGRTNIASILGDGEAKEQQDAAGAPQKESGPKIEIGKISLVGLGADFQDLSLEPDFAISLNDVTGAIEGLSSEQGARAKISLAGRVDDVAPVRIEGQINPLSGDAYTDITVRVDGVSLPAFTPYSGRFVGRRIDRGKLGLNLAYKLNARHLKASNRVLLNQFNFGEKVVSKDASSLPVGLAVAVMRDGKGNVEIPLPIEGDVDDPSFSLLGLLGKAIVNVITKVATSPFAAVAGLVGVSGDDLSEVSFSSGLVTINEEEASELVTLVGVLEKKKSLQLEIRGRANPAIDDAGLRRERVEAALRLDAFQRMSRRAREALSDPEAVVLDADDRLDGLERLYRDQTGGRARDLVPDAEMPPRGPDRTRVVSEAALAALAEAVVLGDADWRSLARSRAAAVQAAVMATEQISADRVFLVDVEISAVGEGTVVPTELLLKVE